MSRCGGRALLATAWALGLAGCGSPAANNNAEAPARFTSHVAAVVARTQGEQAALPAPPAPAAGSAQISTITELPGAARFEVPQVALPDAAASRRINDILTQLLLTNFLEDSTRSASAAQAIARAAAEYKANGQIGVFGTSFEVLYNQRNVLSLALTTEYSGAYPWEATRHATFDLRTGHQLALADLLADTLALRQRWHARINDRLAAYQKEVGHEYKGAPEDAWATVRDYTGWSDTLRQVRPARCPPLGEFALTRRGLVLYTSFEFPHVAIALAPLNDYLFSYAELRPWLAAGNQLKGGR